MNMMKNKNNNNKRENRLRKRLDKIIARTTKAANNDGSPRLTRQRAVRRVLQTIHEKEEQALLPKIQKYKDELKALDHELDFSTTNFSVDNEQDDDPSIITGNFKDGVEDIILEQMTFMITTPQKEELMSEMNQDYTDVLLDDDSNDFSLIDVHLRAASHILNEFFAVQDVILKTASMPSTTQDIVFEVLEDFLYPRVSFHYDPMDKLTPRDAGKIVTWIDEFVDRINQECPDLEIGPSWEHDREALLQHYLDQGVRREMNDVLKRAVELRSKQDVRQESQGHLVTGFPEQVSFIYQQQLKVAHDFLPEKYQELVLDACNQELANCICDMQLEIMAGGWKNMRSSYFCAMLNDACRLSEQCEERNDNVLQTAELKEQGEALVRDLTELSLDITRFLCEYIMNNLREPEPILTSIGTVEWERNERSCATDRTIATFEDFFADLEEWILSSDYYFPKVLQHCFDMTLQTYLESFFANTMAKGVKDPARVSAALETDHIRLVIFFNGSICQKYHGSGGFYKQTVINDRLSILQSLAVLVDPTMQPADIQNDIKVILSQFESGAHGAAVVLHLVGLRKRHHRMESVEWLKAIASALKELDTSTSSSTRSCVGEEKGDNEDVMSSSSAQKSVNHYNVPDLRNSRYLYNIRPTQSEIPRRISDCSRPYADATLQLLKSRAIVNTVHLGIQSVGRRLPSSAFPSKMDKASQ